MDLVLIKWLDSVQPAPDWTWIGGGGEKWGQVVECQSVGWLVYDGEGVKVLAPNRGEICGDVQVSGVIRIPACCVTSIKVLR